MSVGARIALAAALALAALALLRWRVGHTAGTPPGSTAAAAEVPTPGPSAALEALGDNRGALLVYLAADRRRIPAPAAPVLALDASGGLRLLEPPPLPAEPEPGPWLAAGIVLPVDDLEAVTPLARARLLDALRTLAGAGRRLTPDQVVLRVDAPGARAALLRLLAWLR